jgi:signal peptidase I
MFDDPRPGEDDPRPGEDGPAPGLPPTPEAPGSGPSETPSGRVQPVRSGVPETDPAQEPADPVAALASRHQGSRRSSGTGSFLRELPVLLLIAFVLAFLLRTFVLQVFYIPSSSMEPTLQIDDRMVVEKVTYRFREPIRGEVVVFEGDELGPGYAGVSLPNRVVRGVGQFLGVVPASARDFVKRVIGLPGDEVLIEAGQVYVNGEPLDEPYVVYDDGSDYGPVTVPDGHLFFLGDNRPNSSDSRRSLGFVPRDHVVGRSAVIIWPFDHAGSLVDVQHEVPDGEPTS